MTDLSPAAQAVLDGASRANCFRGVDFLDESRWIAAAALEALADQVVPESLEPPCGEDWPWPPAYQQMSDAKWEQRQQIRSEILAIIDELEKEEEKAKLPADLTVLYHALEQLDD